MNSCEVLSLVTAIACTIAKCVPREELPLIAVIFGEISNTLGTIIVNEALEHPKEAVPVPDESPDAGIISVPPVTVTQ